MTSWGWDWGWGWGQGQGWSTEVKCCPIMVVIRSLAVDVILKVPHQPHVLNGYLSVRIRGRVKKGLYIQNLALGEEAHGPGPVGSFLRRQRLGKSFNNSISPSAWTRRNREVFVERARRQMHQMGWKERGI